MRQENIDFIALFEASGWSQAEASRQLDTSPPNISRYLSGAMPPHKTLLKLFKVLLANQKPGALAAAPSLKEDGLSEWERKVLDDLRWLHKEDRERVLKAMRAYMDGLPRREPLSYSGVGKDIEGRALAASKKALEVYRQAKKKASSSNERKGGPGGGARRESSPSRSSEEEGQTKKSSESQS